ECWGILEPWRIKSASDTSSGRPLWAVLLSLVLDRLRREGYGRGDMDAAGQGKASSHAAESIETKRESRGMSEGRANIDQRDNEIRKAVLAYLCQRERRALFVTELATALRKAHGV